MDGPLKKTAAIAALAAVFALTGCGGGSDEAAPATDAPTETDAPVVTEAPTTTAAPAAVTATTTVPVPSVSTGNTKYPATISGRKALDQNGDVYLMRTMSSWAMGQVLTDAQITTALTDVAANGFNAVTVWFGGGFFLNDSWANEYENAAGEDFWTGTPWASSLGTGFDTFDWIVSEADRLGVVVNASLPGGFAGTGAKGDWAAVTNTNMYDAGVAFATRYASATNINWHLMWDDTDTVASTNGQRAEAFMEGVNDTEGISARPFRWIEVGNGNTTDEGGWLASTEWNIPIDCIYDYQDDSVVRMEGVWADNSVLTGDCEPPYVGAPHYGGNERQQLRERSWAVFLEGGSVINFGHEDWWPFGLTGLYTDGLAWTEVQADQSLLDQSYIWPLIDEFVADTTWAPSAFVTTGEGAGDTKAAAGSSDTAALAYFPTSRTIEVNTSLLTGASTVRLRWFDPSNGTYTLIVAEEATQTGRSVTHPGTNDQGQNDWVLVIDTVAAVTA